VDVAEHPAKALSSATANRDKPGLSIFIFSPPITTSVDALVTARGEPNVPGALFKRGQAGRNRQFWQITKYGHLTIQGRAKNLSRILFTREAAC
jgi:hypothetical protein